MAVRRRYRTIHVSRLDRLLAEAEAIGRAMSGGARDAWVHESERIVDDSGNSVWAVVLRVIPHRRQVFNDRLGGGVRKK
jgi:hypothetical protein